MCGIFGIFGSPDKELLKAMSHVLKHRGPDDEGFFFDENMSLGNRRLSIIDVKGGHQPVHNEDSTIWITYNGEIYNFQELGLKLKNLGHKFYTNSDTEVIVHAYEEWGDSCIKEFNGMWAFAVWDSNKKQLFLSRDRLGIKQLYYYLNKKRLVFASEIKAILLDKSIPKMPNDKMIYEYLVYGRHDHTEQTFFNQIKRLLPAHNLLINENGAQINKYWDIENINKEVEKPKADDNHYARKFLELFTDSVRLQLVSEVPIGTCLSGGLDSSSIVCIINQLIRLNKDLTKVVGEWQKTFTACFEDKQIDEREYVKEVIARTNAEQNCIFPDSKQLWKDLPSLVYSQDEPFMSSSVYAQWCVMKLASQKVKVVLDGQGGDELLGGYIPYYWVFIQDLLKKKKIGNFLKELLLSFDLVYPYIKRSLFVASYSKWLNETKELLNADFISEHSKVMHDNPRSKDLPELLYNEITTLSLPRLLRYEDRNSMHFSIESRVPFLDHRLVEYVFSIPMSQRLKNGWTKRVLRNAMKGTLPEKVRKRRKKIGFAIPQVAWMRELAKEIEEVFASTEFGKRKYFKQKEILAKFDEFKNGRLSHYAEIFWRLLNLEMWFRVFIDEQVKVQAS